MDREEVVIRARRGLLYANLRVGRLRLQKLGRFKSVSISPHSIMYLFTSFPYFPNITYIFQTFPNFSVLHIIPMVPVFPIFFVSLILFFPSPLYYQCSVFP